MRLIDADKFIAAYCKSCGSGCDLGEIRCATVDDLMNAPTIDAVPVVRCEDCKYFHKSLAFIRGGVWCDHHGIDIDEDDFCSYGEKRDD